ncbi:putative CENPB DNA-binding domain-containing protein 1 [Uranotaenia lowii]|uniref:putative CENPB DNA-binding domain-containing protein 1 n=1 Tax=Uranotaenia lowii TaxID=190385 RepID=UPI0024792B41|nr:putative CENPB DNA-binding domain-containing protein 1 [Uranotaenia lowii]
MPPKQLPTTSKADKKRCRKSITLGTKLEVLRRLEAGQKIVEIRDAMGLAKSTIQTIRAKKKHIESYLESAAPLNISRFTRQRNWIVETMEALLISWIESNNKRNIPMGQKMIMEKALSICDSLKNGDTGTESFEHISFKASRGWFDSFKRRFKLDNLKISGEGAKTFEGASEENTTTSQGACTPEPDLELFSCEELIQVKLEQTPDEEIENDVSEQLATENLRISERIIEKAAYTRESDPLSYEDLIVEVKSEPVSDEETEHVVSKQLTSEKISKAFSCFEQGIRIFLENDPDYERSAKVALSINSAIKCYKSLKNNKKVRTQSTQTRFSSFFKPVPSMSTKKQNHRFS